MPPFIVRLIFNFITYDMESVRRTFILFVLSIWIYLFNLNRTLRLSVHNISVNEEFFISYSEQLHIKKNVVKSSASCCLTLNILKSCFFFNTCLTAGGGGCWFVPDFFGLCGPADCCGLLDSTRTMIAMVVVEKYLLLREEYYSLLREKYK